MTPEQQAELERRASGRMVAHQDVLRAAILLALVADPSPSAASRRTRVDVKTVRRWRDRFLAEGLPGLDDRDRSGRPPRISPEVRYETISLACGKPEEFGVLFRDVWTCESLARCILDRHPELGTFDPSTAWRYLHASASVAIATTFRDRVAASRESPVTALAAKGTPATVPQPSAASDSWISTRLPMNVALPPGE